MDIFFEIDKYLSFRNGLFSEIRPCDFVMAFFPCTYFCDANALLFSCMHASYKNLPFDDILEKIAKRSSAREQYYRKFCQLTIIAKKQGFPLVIENPYTGSSFLKFFAPFPPAFVDMNRQTHGDFYKKPTAYWAVNCRLSNGLKMCSNSQCFTVAKKNAIPGVRGKAAARSMISPRYAENFVENCILHRYEEPIYRLFSDQNQIFSK